MIESPSLDVSAIRGRFPALSRTLNGSPVVHFDNPAGTQVPQDTIDGYVHYLLTANANTNGTFLTSEASDLIIDAAREATGEFLNAAAGEIVFGPNMTTLTFALSRAIGRLLEPGDEVVLTRLEHDANISPWLTLQERGVQIRYIDIDPENVTLDLDSAAAVITNRTKLVSVGYASNAFGTINDVKRIAAMAHDVGAMVFADAVHYGPHGPIDVADLDVDFLARPRTSSSARTSASCMGADGCWKISTRITSARRAIILPAAGRPARRTTKRSLRCLARWPTLALWPSAATTTAPPCSRTPWRASAHMRSR